MRLAGFGTALSLAALIAQGALAEPATPEGVARIQAGLEKYLGPWASGFTVTAQGDVYNLVMDVTPLVTPWLPPDGRFIQEPYTMVLTDLGNGKWQIDESGSMKISAIIPNVMEYTATIGSIKGRSVFDEALLATESMSYELGDLHTKIVNYGPGGVPMPNVTTTARQVVEGTTSVSESGGIDTSFTSSAENTVQEQTVEFMPGDPPIDVRITAAKTSTSIDLKGFQIQSLADLLAWAVSQSSVASAQAGQADAKAKLKDTLPLFANLTGSGTVTDVRIGTPVGEFAVANVGFELEANGFVADGYLAEKVMLQGFSMPQGLAPEWASGLVPKDLTIGFAFDDFDAAAPIEMLIDTFDATAAEPIPEAMMLPLVTKLIPTGSATISIDDTTLSSDIYSITAAGQVKAGFAGAEGGALVTMTGIDAVLAALQAGPPEQTGQIIGMLGMAQALGKQGENGALVWEFAFTPPSGVSVNGTPLVP